MNKEILKGSIDILLLSIISNGDTYGYEIVKKLIQKSNNLYSMGEGTLYPALKRLELKKLIKSYWGESESAGRRKYYTITEAGKKELDKKVTEWKLVDNLIHGCLEG